MINEILPKIIKDKLADIEQSPEMRQFIGGHGKNIQMPIWVNVFGDSAIDRIMAHNGDVRAAMRFILELLPQPKTAWLKALACTAAIDLTGTKKAAAEYMGMQEYAIAPSRTLGQRIRAITDGIIEISAKDKNSRELPRET